MKRPGSPGRGVSVQAHGSMQPMDDDAWWNKEIVDEWNGMDGQRTGEIASLGPAHSIRMDRDDAPAAPRRRRDRAADRAGAALEGHQPDRRVGRVRWARRGFRPPREHPGLPGL